MLDWYRRGKYDRLELMKNKGGTFRKVGKKYLKGDEDEVEIDTNDGKKSINIPETPNYVNNSGKFVFLVDIVENEQITFKQMKNKGLSSDVQDGILHGNLIQSFVSEMTGGPLDQQTWLIIAFAIGTGVAIGIGIMMSLQLM